MKAAIIYQKDDLRLEDIAKPEGRIRVRVKACAICGTDLRIYRKGDHRARYPIVAGHEIAGIVDYAAPEVTNFKVGDRVCVAPGTGCGKCRMCHLGHPNVCLHPYPPLGYQINGGFAEYLIVPENVIAMGFINVIPENLSFDQASLSEIVACCLNAQNSTVVKENDTVLILGSGPAGIIHSQLARLRGAKKVLLSQRSRTRLEMAKKRFMIDRVIASSEEDLFMIVMDETNGEGADVIYVCAPSAEAQETALKLIAPRGRINFFGGLPQGGNILQVDANPIHYKEFFITGSSSSLPEGNREALRLLSEKKIDPDALITHKFNLQNIHQAFDIAENRSGLKIIINP